MGFNELPCLSIYNSWLHPSSNEMYTQLPCASHLLDTNPSHLLDTKIKSDNKENTVALAIIKLIRKLKNLPQDFRKYFKFLNLS